MLYTRSIYDTIVLVMLMFVKQNKSRNGRILLTYTYGFREDGKIKHKNYETIGYLDVLQHSYPNPVQYFKDQIKIRFKDFKPEENLYLSVKMNQKLSDFNSSLRKNLGHLILNCIYKELNITALLRKQQKLSQARFDLDAILKLLVFSRILFPSSKKETFENKERFFDSFDFSLCDLYRSLDQFDDLKHAIQSTIWENTKKAYDRDASTTYYDCTNFYFEINYNDQDLCDEYGNILEKGYRKRGPEKNHRPDPIIEFGLLMDKHGIPLSYDIFPGNESEKTSLRPIINRTKSKYELGRTIVVADRGLNTSDNMFFLCGKNDDTCKNKDGYVYGQSIRGADKEFKKWVLQQDYRIDNVIENDEVITFKHKSRMICKNITIMRDNKRKNRTSLYQKQLVYYSEKYAKRQRKERNMMIEKANHLIKHPTYYTKATSYGAAAYVQNIEFDKKTGEIKETELVLAKEKILEEEKYDGYYCIVTSELDLSDKEIRDIYKGLWRIEETFKITKSQLRSRPVFVWTPKHMEAHFLTCFISLVIVRLLEMKLAKQYSVKKIIESLRRLECSYLQENYYMIDFRNDVIAEIEKIYGIDFNKKYIHKKIISKILK